MPYATAPQIVQITDPQATIGVFAGEECKGFSNADILFDKPTKEVAKPEETLEAFYGGRCRPVKNAADLAQIDLETRGADNKAEVLGLGYSKLTLVVHTCHAT